MGGGRPAAKVPLVFAVQLTLPAGFADGGPQMCHQGVTLGVEAIESQFHSTDQQQIADTPSAVASQRQNDDHVLDGSEQMEFASQLKHLGQAEKEFGAIRSPSAPNFRYIRWGIAVPHKRQISGATGL
jgi:hypothetical protein